MPTTTKSVSLQVDPALLTIQRRPPAFRIPEGAARGRTGEGSYVARGVHVKTGAPALVHVDGSTMTALPLGVVGTAIATGVITKDEIDALQSVSS